MDDEQCVSLGLQHLWNETKIRCISGSKWQNHPGNTNHPGAEKQTFGRMSQAKGFHKGTWLLGGCLDPWQLPHLSSHLSFPVCSLKTSKSHMILPSPEQENAGIANIFMGWERYFPLNSTQMCSPLLCRDDWGLVKPQGGIPQAVKGFALPKMWHHFCLLLAASFCNYLCERRNLYPRGQGGKASHSSNSRT